MLLWYDCKYKMYSYFSTLLYFIQIRLHIIFSWLGNLQNLLVFICKSKAKNTWKFELLSQSIRISMNGKIFCPYFRIVLSCKYKMMGNMIYQRFVSNIYNLQYNLLVFRYYEAIFYTICLNYCYNAILQYHYIENVTLIIL